MKVRVMLDNPQDIEGNLVMGKFRSGDIRWDKTVRTIKYVLIRRDEPPMYLLDGKFGQMQVEPVGYTRNQLQIVDANEVQPKDIKPINKIDKNRFEVEKLLERKKIKGVFHYLVKWKNYPKSEATYETRRTLMNDIPQLVERFDKKEDEIKKKKK